MSKFTNNQMEKIYKILKTVDEGLLANPEEDWELDHYGERLLNRKGIKDILTKIAKQLPERKIKDLNEIILRRKYSTFRNKIDEGIYELLQKAFESKKQVEIKYFSMGRGTGIRRIIDIYHLTSKYIIAFCHLRKAMRKFRVSRVMDAKLMKQKYKIPLNFNKNEFM